MDQGLVTLSDNLLCGCRKKEVSFNNGTMCRNENLASEIALTRGRQSLNNAATNGEGTESARSPHSKARLGQCEIPSSSSYSLA